MARRACSSGVNGAAVKPSSASRASWLARGQAEPGAAASPLGRRPRGRSKSAVGGARSAASALALVLGGEDPPVAGRERRVLGDRGVEPALARLVGLVEVADEPGLVGVEQVLLDRRHRVVGC